MSLPPSIPSNAPSIASGRYVLASRLGRGGLSVVFRAWDTKLRVWRAIKVLLPAQASRATVRAQFASEARTMAQLEHTNLVRVYDVSDDGPLPFLVMELVGGGTLQDWTDRYGAMPPRLAAEVVLAFVQGVATAHDAGVVHRDIKPQNVLVTPTGTCKLADFGLALTDADSASSIGGTVGYMAPEQRAFASGAATQAVDPRADLYAIGATLWHLLTARAPKDVFLLCEEPGRLDGVPEVLHPILTGCVAYAPDERYADAWSLLADLEAAIDALDAPPPSTAGLASDLGSSLPPVDEATFEDVRALIAPNDEPAPDITGSGPKPMPYTMSAVDPSKRRSVRDLVSASKDEAEPDWIDRTSEEVPRPSRPSRFAGGVGPSPSDEEEKQPAFLIGAGVPTAKETPHVADAVAAEPPSGKTPAQPTPPARSDAPPAQSPAAPSPPPKKKPQRAAASPAKEPQSSGRSWLFTLFTLPLMLLLAGGAGLLLVLALAFGFVSWDVQKAEADTLRAQKQLYDTVGTDRAIVDQLVTIGADRAALEGPLQVFLGTRTEPDKWLAVEAYLRALEEQSDVLANERETAIEQIQMGHALRRLRVARQQYVEHLAHWDVAAATFHGRTVIAMGGAAAPDPTTTPPPAE